MRNLKFRIFDSEIKKYIDISASAIMLDELNNLKPNLKIEQFTGLYDKNGKEIYEGDILFCHEYDSSDTSRCIVQTFKNAVVGFNNGSFYYYPTGNMKQPNQLLMYAYKPEVIGNIYEDSCLLE